MERLVLHERSQIEIRRKEIACMAPLQWLNDEVINIYMALLLERDMRRRSSQVHPQASIGQFLCAASSLVYLGCQACVLLSLLR